MDKWKVGDIIQVDPEYDQVFGGCLMIVSEEKEWGAQGYIKVPGKGDAFLRLKYENGQRVGLAYWVRNDEEKDE